MACTGGVSEVCNNNVDDDMDCDTDCADSDCDTAENCLCDETGGADFLDCFGMYASQGAADAAATTQTTRLPGPKGWLGGWAKVLLTVAAPRG